MSLLIGLFTETRTFRSIRIEPILFFTLHDLSELSVLQALPVRRIFECATMIAVVNQTKQGRTESLS
jgi:hypothetical protein